MDVGDILGVKVGVTTPREESKCLEMGEGGTLGSNLLGGEGGEEEEGGKRKEGVRRGSNLVTGDEGTDMKDTSSSSRARWVGVLAVPVLDVLPPLRVLRTDPLRSGLRCLRTSVPFRVSIDMVQL